MTRALSPPARVLAREFARTLAPFEIRPAADGEVAAGRTLAARLIGDDIVSTEDFRRIHGRNGLGLFLAHEGGTLTGILAFVALNRAGAGALLDGAFDTVAPADAHVASRDEAVAAMYGWGVAAITRDTAARLIAGARLLGRGPSAHLAHYARPTTERGARLMREKLNFQDLAGDRIGLVWLPPFAERGRAAA